MNVGQKMNTATIEVLEVWSINQKNWANTEESDLGRHTLRISEDLIFKLIHIYVTNKEDTACVVYKWTDRLQSNSIAKSEVTYDNEISFQKEIV